MHNVKNNVNENNKFIQTLTKPELIPAIYERFKRSGNRQLLLHAISKNVTQSIKQHGCIKVLHLKSNDDIQKFFEPYTFKPDSLQHLIIGQYGIDYCHIDKDIISNIIAQCQNLKAITFINYPDIHDILKSKEVKSLKKLTKLGLLSNLEKTCAENIQKINKLSSLQKRTLPPVVSGTKLDTVDTNSETLPSLLKKSYTHLTDLDVSLKFRPIDLIKSVPDVKNVRLFCKYVLENRSLIQKHGQEMESLLQSVDNDINITQEIDLSEHQIRHGSSLNSLEDIKLLANDKSCINFTNTDILHNNYDQ